MTEESGKRTLITVINNKNVKEDIYFEECGHCTEKIPVVGLCSKCGTDYVHMRTFEDYETGVLHYIYVCSGCPDDQRKVRKMVKIYNGNVKTVSRVHELVQDFLY